MASAPDNNPPVPSASGAPNTGAGQRRAKAIPVNVLTGFLGSGKTTLLNKLLAHPDMGESAVLVNEFGEIGIDHLLVRETREDAVLLNSGCLCCTVRGDLVNAMRELFWQRVDLSVPRFKRLIIETTGLADPAPVIHTLMTDPTIGGRYRFDGVVTTVDAVNGPGLLETQTESLKQAAVADRIVVTKTDLAAAEQIRDVRSRLHGLNPGALLFDASDDLHPDMLFNAGLFDEKTRIPDVAKWLREEAVSGARANDHADNHADDHADDHANDHDHGRHPHDVNRHGEHIQSFCVTLDAPVRWEGFATCIEMLTATQGENLLRIKGILNVDGEDGPIAVHGVQHLFHPPVRLPGWPGEDRRSKLVFITRDIGKQPIEDVMKAFTGGDG